MCKNDQVEQWQMQSAGENLFFQWEIDIAHPRPQFGGARAKSWTKYA